MQQQILELGFVITWLGHGSSPGCGVGKWNTVFKRFRDWVKADVFQRLFDAVSAYSTRWRTRFHADGGQCSSVMADSVPR
ncbi:hypothetical protein E4O93_06490 [Diaphorobacter sp. DS2]|nr:hypothetical protein E4O93_06490 [Diaphorobacter sp. DS2]